jgi:tetratricopeptide (TPR) repeat protein
MAVLIEALSVVVRRDAIVRSYTGGWDQFVIDVPNMTLCADDYLARVGFMIPADAKAFMARLENLGLVYCQGGKAADFVCVDQKRGPTIEVDWLNLGGVEIQTGKIKLGWFHLEEPDGRVALPADPNWTAAETVEEILPEEMDDRMKFLRRENNMDVYLNLRTGKETYVGRPEVQGGGTASASLALEAICHEAFQLEAKADPLIALQDREGAEPIFKRLSEELLPAAVALAEGDGKELSLGHYTVGLVLRILHEPAAAEPCFRHANQLSPKNPLVLRELVKCLGEQNRGPEALPFAREAVEASPMDAAAWGNLTMCLIQCGHREEARKSLREALIIDPQDRLNRYISDNFDGYFKTT